MKKSLVQTVVVGLFVAVCAGIFSVLWINSGGNLPGYTQAEYKITAYVPRAGNAVYYSDVRLSGVRVGKILEIEPSGDSARVLIGFTDYGPLHEGATVRVGAKTLIEESYLDVTDGTGPPLASGAELPKSAGIGPVQVNDVLLALDPKTKSALAESMRGFGAATVGTRQAFSDAVAGLGGLGRGGHDALDALAAQSEDLKELTGHTATTLAALNTQRGQIAQLVQDANELTTATAEGKEDLAEVMRTLPPVLRSASAASASLTELGQALQPVARNLDAAAPDLSAALRELPDSSAQLRGLLPDLDGSLGKAPDTLTRVPDTADVVQELIPQTITDLADINPILGYLKPYGVDIASFLPNFAQTLAHSDSNGKYFYAQIVVNEKSLTSPPVNTNIGPFDRYNPYPNPGYGYKPNGKGRGFTKLHEEGPN